MGLNEDCDPVGYKASLPSQLPCPLLSADQLNTHHANDTGAFREPKVPGTAFRRFFGVRRT